MINFETAVQFLLAGNPKQQRTAARFLGEMNTPEATTLLLEAMETVSWDACKELGHALGNKGDVLLGILAARLHHQDNRVRQVAVIALSKIGTCEALEALLEYYQNNGTATQTDEGLLESLRNTRDPRCLYILWEFLRHTNPLVRTAAVEGLKHIGTPDVIEDIEAAMEKNRVDDLTSMITLYYLGKQFEMLPFLFRVFTDDWRVERRMKAAEALAETRDPYLVPVLIPLLADEGVLIVKDRVRVCDVAAAILRAIDTAEAWAALHDWGANSR